MPTTPPVTHLLYLHGFRSSPQPIKAKAMAAAVQQHQPSVLWWGVPATAAALPLLLVGLENWFLAAKGNQLAIAASSLGGFYAVALARRMDCPAVLINPAADPARDLAWHIGAQTSRYDAAQTFFSSLASSTSFRPRAAAGSQHQRIPWSSSGRVTRCRTGAKWPRVASRPRFNEPRAATTP